MIHPSLLNRCRRAAIGALLSAAIALLPACSSSNDKRPLVLVSAPLGAYAGLAKTVKVTVTVDGVPVATTTVSAADDPTTGDIGVYLPSGTSGDAAVVVLVTDANGCLVASGGSTATVKVSPGETTGQVTITLSAATGSCAADGGTSDSGPDAAESSPDVSVHDGLPGPELPPVVADGSSVADTPPGGAQDAPAADKPNPDVAAGPDAATDAKADAQPSTLNVFGNCTPYTHSVKDSTGAIEDWGIRGFAFSPDGKVLVSMGEDGRAKVWNITAAGLQETSSGLVFTGYSDLSGAISPDGHYIAVGDKESLVTVYDLPVSLQYGSASTVTTFPPGDTLSATLRPTLLQFTNDGGHLIAMYRAADSPNPNQFVVWNLGTNAMDRLVSYDYSDEPMAILPGAYTDAMWVASSTITTTDAGDDESVVTLVDLATPAPRSKAQFTVPGDINAITFSPDGTTLAIATDQGEVGLWDITTKSSITRLGSPLIAASSAANSAYSLAYTADGKYLAMGTGDLFGSSTVRLQSLQPRMSLQKTIDYIPWSLAFSPDGQALAIGERDLGVLLYCKN
jgi:WD40 repeat protein